MIIFLAVIVFPTMVMARHTVKIGNTLDVKMVTAVQTACIPTGDDIFGGNFDVKKMIDIASSGGLHKGAVQTHIAGPHGDNTYETPSHCLTAFGKEPAFWTVAVAFYKDGSLYVGRMPSGRLPYMPVHHLNNFSVRKVGNSYRFVCVDSHCGGGILAGERGIPAGEIKEVANMAQAKILWSIYTGDMGGALNDHLAEVKPHRPSFW
ncbi:hypothetical protein [Chlorobium sp. N1]|uniref:hypothetical protein n=1 Tax=Chlorobium sp. N1 TaxID=2491138 RepID=UPI00103CD1A2|nr:hypothetical protein [Chlorobium sp. N1]TCD47381.1 hypothetical protein E0L29_07475 [Chlorobium sp. N1]